MAGGGHLSVHKDVEILPAGLLGPDALFLEALCQFPLNTTADGPVFVSYMFNALWENMEDQVRTGAVPPAGLQMAVVGEVVQRDSFGNGLGGVRLPALEVPVATYTPGNQADPNLPPFLQGLGNLACRLGSSVTPFDEGTLAELYPNHTSYLSEVVEASNQLVSDGLLLAFDRTTIIATAAQSGETNGDVDGDGDVDQDDLDIVVSCFGQLVADNPDCAVADCAPPPDGVINILDVSFVGSSFTPGLDQGLDEIGLEGTGQEEISSPETGGGPGSRRRGPGGRRGRRGSR